MATVYAAMFPARLDVYSRWIDGVGWRPIRQPLTPEVIVDGLARRGPSVSGFLVSPASQSRSMAFDFDTDDGLEQARSAQTAMRTLGLNGYVFTSRRGAHLWSTLDREMEARTVRKAMRVILSTALLPVDDPKIEMRPGQDALAEGGVGLAIRLPFMPNPKTGMQPEGFDDEGRRIGPKVSDAILDWRESSHEVVASLAMRWRPTATRVPRDFAVTFTGPDAYEKASASDILRQLWGVENAVPGKAVRCPAHDDSVPSLSILRDDRRAICKSPVCILHNLGHGRGTFELTRYAPHAA